MGRASAFKWLSSRRPPYRFDDQRILQNRKLFFAQNMV
jgi:hypothetical protein